MAAGPGVLQAGAVSPQCGAGGRVKRSPAPQASGAAGSEDACGRPQARRGSGWGFPAQAAYVPSGASGS